jgi:DNA-binding MarR family transcriptional regulator
MTSKLDLANFLPYQLSVASNAVSDRVARIYQARFGLKIPEWRLMAVLGEGTARTQRDLVGLTRMDKVTVSRAAAALADRDLVSREASESDGRSHHLTLTDDGWRLYNDIAPAALELEKSIVACLSAEELQGFVDMMARLRDAADQLQDRA